MKKISVSLFAVCAIAFAVFSAFTTTSKSSKALLSGFYANQNSTTSSFDGVNADATSAADDETEANITTLIGSTYQDLQDYKDQNCDNNISVVCAVEILSDQVIDVKNGVHQ